MALFYPHYPTLFHVLSIVLFIHFVTLGTLETLGSSLLQSQAQWSSKDQLASNLMRQRGDFSILWGCSTYIYIYNIIIYIYVYALDIYIYNVYILTAKLCPCFFVGFCFGNHLTLPREWVRWVKGINGHDPMVSNVCFHSMCGPVDDGKHHGASARCGLFLPMLQLLALKVEKTCPH